MYKKCTVYVVCSMYNIAYGYGTLTFRACLQCMYIECILNGWQPLFQFNIHYVTDPCNVNTFHLIQTASTYGLLFSQPWWLRNVRLQFWLEHMTGIFSQIPQSHATLTCIFINKPYWKPTILKLIATDLLHNSPLIYYYVSYK